MNLMNIGLEVPFGMLKHLLKKRLFRYIISGLLSFTVENIAFNTSYYLLDYSPKLANVISIGIALIVNFFVSKYFVFNDKSEGKKVIKQFLAYIIVIIFNLTISSICIEYLIEQNLSGFIAKFFVTILTVMWTFVLYKKLIFVYATKV